MPLGPFDHLQKTGHILSGRHVVVTGQRAEQKLEARLIDEHEGIGIALFQAAQLNIDASGHEFKHEWPDRIIEQDGPFVLIDHIESKADRPFKLPADRGPHGMVQFQKPVVHHRIGRTDVKIGGFFKMRQGFLDFIHKLVHGKPKRFFNHIQNNSRKVLGRLNIHVFVIIQPGKLGPERYIQG